METTKRWSRQTQMTIAAMGLAMAGVGSGCTDEYLETHELELTLQCSDDPGVELTGIYQVSYLEYGLEYPDRCEGRLPLWSSSCVAKSAPIYLVNGDSFVSDGRVSGLSEDGVTYHFTLIDAFSLPEDDIRATGPAYCHLRRDQLGQKIACTRSTGCFLRATLRD